MGSISKICGLVVAGLLITLAVPLHAEPAARSPKTEGRAL